jgi:hypothetical protein
VKAGAPLVLRWRRSQKIPACAKGGIALLMILMKIILAAEHYHMLQRDICRILREID